MRSVVKARNHWPLTFFTTCAKQREAGVGIEEFRARLEVEVFLAGHHRQNIGVGDQVERVAPAGNRQQLPLIAQTAGVVQEVTERDRRAEIRQLGHVFAHGIVEPDLAFLRQHQDRGRGELLRHRRDMDPARWRDLEVVIEIGHAVAALIDDAAILHHRERAARRCRLVPGGEQLIDPGGLSPAAAGLADHHAIDAQLADASSMRRMRSRTGGSGGSA